MSRHPRLVRWLSDKSLLHALKSLTSSFWADLDPTFHPKIDEDFDHKQSGITRASFLSVYHNWIIYCITARERLDSDEIKKKKEDKEKKEKEELEKRNLADRLFRARGGGGGGHSSEGRVKFNGSSTTIDMDGIRRTAEALADGRGRPSKQESQEGGKATESPSLKSVSAAGGAAAEDSDPAATDRLMSQELKHSANVAPSASATNDTSDAQYSAVRRVTPDGMVFYDSSEDSAMVTLCFALSLLGECPGAKILTSVSV